MTAWLRFCTFAVFGVAWILSGGCASLSTQPAPAEEGLSTADRDLARAFAHFTLARIHEANPKEAAKAIEQYLLAAEADPARQLHYTAAARTAIRHLDLPTAIAILHTNALLNATNPTAHFELACVYQLAGQRDAATAAFEKTIALSPTNPIPYVYLANLQFTRGYDSNAIAALTRGVRQSSARDVLGAYCYRVGKEMIDTRQFARAIPCLELVADTMENDNGIVHQLIGQIYETLEDLPRAMKHYEAAAAATPPVAQAVVKLAWSQMPDAAPKAIRLLQNTLGKTENDSELLFALALIQEESGNLPAALASFEAIRHQHVATNPAPLAENFYLAYADARLHAGETNQAETLLFECLTAHPDSHRAMNFLAYTWAERGIRLDKALSYVTQALAAMPENGAYLDTLGWIQFKQGRNQDAIATLLRAFEQMEDAVIAEHIGDVYLAIDDTAHAVEYWKRSFALDNTVASVRNKLKVQGADPDSIPPAETPARP